MKIGVGISYINLFVNFIIGIIYTPVMLRILGQSEYGLYNLTASIVSYLSLFSLGFSSAYVRYYSKYKVNQDYKSIGKLNGIFLIVFFILSTAAFVTGISLTYNLPLFLGNSLSSTELDTAQSLMFILVITMSISLINIVFDSFISANEKFLFQRGLTLLKTILNPFLVLPLLLMGYQSIAITIISFILTFFVFVLNILYCFKKLKMRISFKHLEMKLIKEIALFSSFIFINILVDQLNGNVDKFILGKYQGTISVAVYSVGAQFNTYFSQVSTSISSVFVPRINQLVFSEKNSDRDIDLLFAKVGRIQFLILLPILIGLIYFGKYFILLWAGAGYEDSFYIALLLISPTIVPLIQNIGIEVQRAKNKHAYRSFLYLFLAILNIACSIPLAQLWGGIGAAFGTFIANIVGAIILMNIMYEKVIGLDIVYFWKQIFLFTPHVVLTIIAAKIVTILLPSTSLISFLIGGLIFCLMYLVSAWKIGMNSFEKNLFYNLYSSITKRKEG